MWKLYFYLAGHLAKKNQKGRLPVKQDMQRLNCSFRPAFSSATPMKTIFASFCGVNCAREAAKAVSQKEQEGARPPGK